MNDKTLQSAYKLFVQQKYDQVIRLLEPQIFRFRDNFDFYFILGFACFYTKDIGGAYSFLRRAADINEADIPTRLGLALVHVYKNSLQLAINEWLDILDLDPNNKHAQRALDFIKQNPNTDKIIQELENNKLSKFLPSQKKNKPMRILLNSSIAITLISILIFIWYFFDLSELISLEKINIFNHNHHEREVNDPLVFSIDARQKDMLSLSGNFDIILTEKEIKTIFQEVEKLFHEYRDNKIRKELNKILISNASVDIKEKAKTILRYLSVPDFTSLKDNYTYKEVIQAPTQFHGCYVIWKGKATNVKIRSNEISFDFLIGYEDGEILEGIVPTILTFAVELDPKIPYEILGQILAEDKESFYLKVISLHPLH